jgi:hypothetical protein
MGRINQKYKILEKGLVEYHVDLALNVTKKASVKLVFLFTYLYFV